MFATTTKLFFVCAYDGSNVTEAAIEIEGKPGYMTETIVTLAPAIKASLFMLSTISQAAPTGAYVAQGLNMVSGYFGSATGSAAFDILTKQVDKVLPLVSTAAARAKKFDQGVIGGLQSVKDWTGIDVKATLESGLKTAQGEEDKMATGEKKRKVLAAAQALTGPAFQLVKQLAEKQGVIQKVKNAMRRVVDADGSIAWVKAENVFLARGNGGVHLSHRALDKNIIRQGIEWIQGK